MSYCLWAKNFLKSRDTVGAMNYDLILYYGENFGLATLEMLSHRGGTKVSITFYCHSQFYPSLTFSFLFSSFQRTVPSSIYPQNLSLMSSLFLGNGEQRWSWYDFGLEDTERKRRGLLKWVKKKKADLCATKIR